MYRMDKSSDIPIRLALWNWHHSATSLTIESTKPPLPQIRSSRTKLWSPRAKLWSAGAKLWSPLIVLWFQKISKSPLVILSNYAFPFLNKTIVPADIFGNTV